ncbi:hypothetical protein [Bremerella sp. P1]|uniref:hypothetical protein n=1 Tax=Bremerella sp. P1 TaxID=3026424 RepID=UPI002368406A|nr:hypothetical protein [Bremerella sp. P1]WDI44751.1 hypothetical protein PSR63_12475 [Bremerella sp. P1]
MASKRPDVRVTRHALKRFKTRGGGTRSDMLKSLHKARECEPWQIERIKAGCPESHDDGAFFCTDQGLIYVCKKDMGQVVVITVLKTKDLGGV